MSDDPKPLVNMTSGFRFSHVRANHKVVTPPPPAPPLGPLAAFVGDWTGNGFNTIFRPQNPATPTPLPHPDPTSDNILELNLTSEVLSFSPSLGSVPNRGTSPQADLFLNGVPYLQRVNDITTPGESVGIHFEPGMWIHVPATTVPQLGETVARMASIPHGTTIEAQGNFFTVNGGPKIDPVDITPFKIGNPAQKIKFPSQTATAQNTPRIPQDLTPFIHNGTITQAILDDPNSVLRDHIKNQKIVQTSVIVINTQAPPIPVGGGTDNIAFLVGPAGGAAPNANAVQMTAIFWIETVEEVIHIPPFKRGQPPHIISATPSVPGQLAAKFSVEPPIDIDKPRDITVHFTQIQYTQTVFLNFKGLTWPHVSVNTLVPAAHVVVPPTVWGK
ncbi:MAG TPA: heme-binding protein [Candidatus Angelobacter sp.]|nr:heme-binding protein [Candidatus Angelobacter sp.]